MSSANLLFLGLLIVGPVVSVSSNNWIVCWAGVELSFLGLIPLLFLSNKYASLTKESSMKYFCIQALGSALLFYSGLMVFSNLGSEFTNIMLVSSIFIKLGVFPMHFWVPSVAAGLDWFPLFFILTVQKVAPFAFLTLVVSSFSGNLLMVLAIMGGLTSVVGSFLGNNQTDLRAMLGCSSIAHSGWLILGCLTGYFWGYFFIYCLSLFLVFLFLNNSSSQMETGMGVLSLSGLPPFFMFLGKWGILKSTLESGFPVWLISFFLLGAVISLGFYLKFSYSFVLNSNNSLWSPNRKSVALSFLVLNFTLLIFFLLV
uniref:NADH-ubiquinone oxidoreductase chain 2 n=1 Tax=Elysia chlorotica TaxID=188477 RepID=B2D6J9_ELYCH|nr:NADH dehydrogenase subunit 2 [Elysia chlorotica]ACB70190.1 NADH dehydrogenase subunit 2 [Elysia chlorotica]